MRRLIFVFAFSLVASTVRAQGGLVAWPEVELGNDLIRNGTFEADLSKWSAIPENTTRDCTVAHSGSCSLKISDWCSVPFATSIKTAFTSRVGGVYRFSAWVKYNNITAGINGIRIGIVTTDATGGAQAGVSGTSDWRELRVDSIALQTAKGARFQINQYGCPAGDLWVDDITVVEELKPSVEAKLIQPSYRGYLWSDMDQEAVFEVTNNLGYIPIDAQDETDYDDSPTSEGTFAGGTGHAGSDVITLSDGTTITVDAVSSSVVTGFTVDAAGTRFGNLAGGTLTQASTTGSGVGFSLTTGADNVTNTVESVIELDSDPGNPTIADAAITDGLVTLAISEDGSIAFRNKGQGTPSYPEYRIDAIDASERTTWPLSWTDDNRFRINDTPSFILGVYDSALGYSSTEGGYDATFDTNRRLNELAGNVNAYLNYWWGKVPVINLLPMMDSLKNAKHQIPLYWQTSNCFGTTTEVIDISPSTNDGEYAEGIAAHSGLAGLYVMDECDVSLADDVFAYTSVTRSWIPKGADLAVHFPANSPNIEKWYDVADILATDPYPLYGSEPATGYPLNFVGKWSKYTRQAVSDSRPFMTVIQFFLFTANSRWPTEDELKRMSYMAITEGAQGLFYWSLGARALAYVSGPARWEYYERLKNTVAEIRSMEPVILLPDEPGHLVATDNSNIRTLVKDGYIFAYNDTSDTQAVTFTWDEPVSDVVALHEGSPDRSIAPRSARFSDTFAGYGTHVYEIKGGGAPPDTE